MSEISNIRDVENIIERQVQAKVAELLAKVEYQREPDLAGTIEREVQSRVAEAIAKLELDRDIEAVAHVEVGGGE